MGASRSTEIPIGSVIFCEMSIFPFASLASQSAIFGLFASIVSGTAFSAVALSVNEEAASNFLGRRTIQGAGRTAECHGSQPYRMN